MENWQIGLLLFVVLIIVIGLCYQASKKPKSGANEDEFEYEMNGGDEFDDDEY